MSHCHAIHANDEFANDHTLPKKSLFVEDNTIFVYCVCISVCVWGDVIMRMSVGSVSV